MGENEILPAPARISDPIGVFVLIKTNGKLGMFTIFSCLSQSRGKKEVSG
jgi:hypothetical protein